MFVALKTTNWFQYYLSFWVYIFSINIDMCNVIYANKVHFILCLHLISNAEFKKKQSTKYKVGTCVALVCCTYRYKYSNQSSCRLPKLYLVRRTEYRIVEVHLMRKFIIHKNVYIYFWWLKKIYSTKYMKAGTS